VVEMVVVVGGSVEGSICRVVLGENMVEGDNVDVEENIISSVEVNGDSVEESIVKLAVDVVVRFVVSMSKNSVVVEGENAEENVVSSVEVNRDTVEESTVNLSVEVVVRLVVSRSKNSVVVGGRDELWAVTGEITDASVAFGGRNVVESNVESVDNGEVASVVNIETRSVEDDMVVVSGEASGVNVEASIVVDALTVAGKVESSKVAGSAVVEVTADGGGGWLGWNTGAGAELVTLKNSRTLGGILTGPRGAAIAGD
jgi:hypothetical protein